MKTLIYAVYDEVAEEYSTIFEAKSDAVAIRNFTNQLKFQRSVVKEDYVLMRFGTFDNVEGVFDLLQVPEMIYEGVSVEVIQDEKAV